MTPARPSSSRSRQPLPLPEALSLVGRDRERETVCTLVRGHSLVTLLGPGGVGKTRLALSVADELKGEFAQGARLVLLSALTDATLLAPTVAGAVGVKLTGSADPAEKLVRQLRKREMLLVLDNFEQLLDGTALLQRIRVQAPGVRMLVTSRVPLGLRKEKLFRLGGLSLPEAGEEAKESEAVRLFVERARERKPGWRLRGREDAVVRICRAVEGLPLGIELAAAWVGERTLSKIAGEVERRREEFLEEKLSEVPGWQPGLRAVLGSAWAQLEEEERRVFRGVSVFRGGFTRGAAAEVLGASLLSLEWLLERSLLRRTGPERYDVHEVLRQYGREKLKEAGEEETTAKRHARYFAGLLARLEDRVYLDREAAAEIEEEIENVRAAWDRATADGDAETIRSSLVAAYRFYSVKSWLREGEEAFGRAAEGLRTRRRGSRGRTVRGMLLARRGELLRRRGRFDEARSLLEEGLGLLRSGTDRREIVAVQGGLANLLLSIGLYDEAIRTYMQNVDVCREVGDPHLMGAIYANAGEALRLAGRPDGAREHLRTALGIFRDLGEEFSLHVHCLHTLATVEHGQGNYAEAHRLGLEALEISRRFEDVWGAALAELILGRVCAASGDPAAWEYFRAALAEAVRSQAEPTVLEVLLGVAELWLREGRAESAREVLLLVRSHPASERELRDRAEELCRSAGPAEVDRSPRPLEEIVREILAPAPPA